MLKTSATKRSYAIVSFRSTSKALEYLRCGDEQRVKCDETAVTLFHSRQFDDELSKPVHKSCVTVANEQSPQFKVVCSQTLASRISSKKSSFALDAG